MHKTTPSVDCNYWLKRLDIQLNQSTNKNSIKVPRVVEPKIRKRYYKHFNVPSLMHITVIKYAFILSCFENTHFIKVKE